MQHTTRPLVLDWRKYLDAGELTLWVVVVIAVAYWANIVRGALPNADGTLASFANAIVNNGAFDVFAWLLILIRVASPSHTPPASPLHIATAILAGIVVLVPARLACAVALVIIATPLLIDRTSPPATRQIRPLLFALAFEVVWMSPLLAPFHVVVGGLDARMTASLLRASGESAMSYANVVNNISAGFSIAVWPQCASSFPLVDVVLAFLVVLSYRGQTLRIAHLGWLAASLATSVLLTELRLPLLAAGANSYRWWHFGPGVTGYALVAVCAAVVFPLLASADRCGTPHHATGLTVT
jgi:hypothetical protein